MVEKEIWKKIVFEENINPKEKYSVSNFGRIKSFKVKKHGRLSKLTAKGNQYVVLGLKSIDNRKTGRLVHRLVALAFLKKETEFHNLVIHLNYKKGDNRAVNLKWATKEEVHIHALRRKKKSKARDKAIEHLKTNNHLAIDTKYGEEIWKTIKFNSQIKSSEKYQISNYGRIISYKSDKVDGKIRRIGYLNSYQALQVKQITGKTTGRYIHKLVAETFIPKLDLEKTVVIHIDYNKDNNHVSNLRWANSLEANKHLRSNPNYKVPNAKLTEAKVKLIKMKLANPKRKTRVKILAKQFGVSEMQLWRIKTGENWGHVTI